MASSSQGSIQISDDEVFRRKLLMDGEGMGDERRLTILLRNFYTWFDSKGDSEDQIVSGYESLLTSLGNCEFLMTKSRQSQAANEAEIKNYALLEAEIEKNISTIQETILKKKDELKQAKKIREHKQQYDALARMISELPDRKETEAKLQVLNEEISSLINSTQELEKKIDTRHKEMQVLLSSAALLKESLTKDMESASDSD